MVPADAVLYWACMRCGVLSSLPLTSFLPVQVFAYVQSMLTMWCVWNVLCRVAKLIRDLVLFLRFFPLPLRWRSRYGCARRGDNNFLTKSMVQKNGVWPLETGGECRLYVG